MLLLKCLWVNVSDDVGMYFQLTHKDRLCSNQFKSTWQVEAHFRLIQSKYRSAFFFKFYTHFNFTHNKGKGMLQNINYQKWFYTSDDLLY